MIIKSALIHRLRNLSDIKRSIDKYGFSKTFYFEDTIGIFGSARSGTTWLMELLYQIPNYSTIFEPFHPQWFLESDTNGFSPKPYLKDKDTEKKLFSYLEQVFTGKKLSIMPKYSFSPKEIYKRLKTEKIIVKSVRANLILPWISDNFNLRRTILITRHPCAVISSQLQTGYTGYTKNTGQNYIPTKNELNNITNSILPKNSEMTDKLMGLKDNIEILAFNWGIENYIPLKYCNKNNVHILKYENLFSNPKEELFQLLSKIKEESHLEDILSKIEKPSISTRSMDLNHLNDRQEIIHKWKRNLSETDIQKITDVLDVFNFKVTNDDYIFDISGIED